MIDLDELERKLNEVLENETPESLQKWLDKKREEERIADLEGRRNELPKCKWCKNKAEELEDGLCRVCLEVGVRTKLDGGQVNT